MSLVWHQLWQYKLFIEPSQFYIQSLDCLSLLQFLIFCSIWMLKSNFESKTKRKCFWCGHGARILLLNVTGWYAHVYDIWKKITSFACFFGSSLNWILHWCAQFLVLFKSEFRVFREFLYQWFLKKVNYNQQRFYKFT